MRSGKGKALLVNAYSLLQDHFYDHMKEAGFRDLERGERGSTAEHLSVLEYKSQQEAERAAALAADIAQKQQTAAVLAADVEQKRQAAAVLDQQTEKKQKRLEKLNDSITVKGKAAAAISEIDAIGKPALLGGFSVSADDMKKLKTLAKKSVTADEKVKDMKHRLATAERERDELQAEKAAVRKTQPSITEHVALFSKYSSAMKRDPKRLAATVEDILRQPTQRREQEQATPERRRATGLDR
jgi:DUF971 family protein